MRDDHGVLSQEVEVLSILGDNLRGSPGVRENRAVASDALGKLMLGLALLLLACASLLALAKPGWAQEADQADLAMFKGAYSEPAVTGEPLTYYVYVENLGPGTATNVVVEDTLPEVVDFVGFNQGGGQCSYDGDARTVACNFGDLPVFVYGYAEFQVTPAAEGTLQNTATVTSDTLDPNAENNQATATTTVVAPTADLSVEKSAPGSGFVGEPFDYRISVSNNGPTSAPNTVGEDTLPQSVSFWDFPNDDGRCSFDESAHKVSCDLGSLGSFNSDEVRIQVTPIEEGTAENTASVSSGAPDPDDSNNQDTATTSVGTAPSPPGSLVNDPGCQTNTLPRNDDGSTGAVGLPFTPNFFGNSYGTAYVNNNGNVTFDGPLRTFTPFNLRSTRTPIIAPFFADVDTRAQGSDAVTYGTADFGGRDAFCVNWTGVAGGVGYYTSHDDKLNSFQLLLVDRSDIGPGDFDIIMNYNKIRWETGDASGGTGGLGGDSARARYSNGSTASFELPGSAGPFEVVENDSAIMSPSNRTNPDTTDAENPETDAEEGGHFGWDVIAGYYKVRAEKVGCHAPGDETQSFVETEVMEIPPPVTNLDIRLDCPEPPNEPPTAADDQTVTLDDGASANFQLDASDPDGDTLIYTEGVLANGSGTLECDDSGACTYMPTDENFNGSDSFTYTVDDGNGGADEGTVSITVRSVNDNPVAKNDPSEDGSFEVNEDEQLTVGAANGVLGNDTDADNDPLTAELVGLPAHAASFDLRADGSFDYKPEANFHQSDFFTYKAKDANSESNVATATINVSPVNDPPEFITRIADQRIAENASTGELYFSITDNEVNGANLIRVSASSDDQTLVPHSGIEVGGSGSYRFVKVTPAQNESGTATITVTLTDPEGATSTDEFLLTVNPAGDETPPSITINTPEDGAEYKLDQLLAANYFCSDGGSGVSVCDGTVDSGSNIDTASVGSKTFTMDAEDVAGNTVSASHDYSVVYDFGNGSDGGFLPPVEAFPTLNSMKAGAAVPVKFALGGDQGLDIFAEGYPLSRSIPCSAELRTDAIEMTVAASNSGLRYDTATGHYGYNWKTQKGWSNTCRQLILKFDDGTEHPINFKFK